MKFLYLRFSCYHWKYVSVYSKNPFFFFWALIMWLYLSTQNSAGHISLEWLCARQWKCIDEQQRSPASKPASVYHEQSTKYLTHLGTGSWRNQGLPRLSDYKTAVFHHTNSLALLPCFISCISFSCFQPLSEISVRTGTLFQLILKHSEQYLENKAPSINIC